MCTHHTHHGVCCSLMAQCLLLLLLLCGVAAHTYTHTHDTAHTLLPPPLLLLLLLRADVGASACASRVTWNGCEPVMAVIRRV